jgi:alpha-galactosidase
LVCTGNYYRLTSPFKDTHVAWMFVSQDGKEVLFNDVLRDRHANQEFGYVKLKGLNPNAVYINEETGIAYHGDVLMEAGLPLPMMGEYQAYQIHLILGEI